ncbi:MAG: ABC transporter ATP-binding protein [Bdellovibrionota bacterium]
MHKFLVVDIAMIVVENLSKHFGSKHAVDQVSFQILDNEIVGILGLNGAGKSTILKMLGTFLLPSSGKAMVAGYSVIDNPDEVRRNIGYLPDLPPLYNEMTVVPYLKFVARLKDVPVNKVLSYVDEAIEKTNLSEAVGVKLGALSHGFRQRVGIASALVHKPKVLILDEPINGLDPVQIVGMRDLVIGLKSDHTVILSSHILSEITKTCDRILIIDKGTLVAEGSEQELARGIGQNMKLTCEVDNLSDNLRNALDEIPEIKTIDVMGPPNARARLVLETTADVRSKVAGAVVHSGTDLLSFTSENAGLESLFMKLVGTDHQKGDLSE